MTDRIEDIIIEAVGNGTISRITTAEREEIAELFLKQTGERIDKFCNACIIRACYGLNRNLKNTENGKAKKNRRK